MKYYKVCRVRCKVCGDVLEYENESKQDRGPRAPMVCSCRRVALDPSAVMYRILGDENDYEDLSEPWKEQER